MVCQACGSEISTAEVRFCPKCGAPIAAQPVSQQPGVQGAAPQPQPYAGYPPYPPYPPAVVVPRVQRHLQTLGTLWCVYGVYRVFSGFFGVFFLRAFAWRHWGGPWGWGGGPFGMHGPPWLAFVPAIVTITVVMAALSLFAGFSLLRRKPWGRTLTIVLAILALFKPIVGTALGIYTLWVLAPSASGLEYDSIADHS